MQMIKRVFYENLASTRKKSKTMAMRTAKSLVDSKIAVAAGAKPVS